MLINVRGLREGYLDSITIRRPWTSSERRVVRRGLIGRALIAIEPVICGIVFAAMAIALAAKWPQPQELTPYIAPVFALAFVFCVLWAVGLMFAPVRAFAHTFGPIYIVDGYLRSRRPDDAAEIDQSGYFAVLDDRRRIVAEWPVYGDALLPNAVRPALVEFSRYGGIHRVDGRGTGIVPESLRPLGVGETRPRVRP